MDVRSNPYSKYVPQFNKENIKRSCDEQDIHYLFLGDKLGGKPNNISNYVKNWKELYEFLAKRPSFNDGIQILIKTALKSKTCIMCAERNPEKCH